MTTTYTEPFKPITEVTAPEAATTFATLGKRSHVLLIIVGSDRKVIQDVALAFVRERYPNLGQTGIWFATDHPEEIGVGPASAKEAEEDWYFGGGRAVFNPHDLPPLPEGAAPMDPLIRIMRDGSRRDLDAFCLLTTPTTAEAWESVLNNYFAGTTVIIGIERPAGTLVTVPPSTDAGVDLGLLFSKEADLQVFNTDTQTFVPTATALSQGA